MKGECEVQNARSVLGGFTLLEMVVVLALLGLILGLATVAVVSLRPPRQARRVAAIDSASAAAIRTGTRVHLTLNLADTTAHVALHIAHWTFLPDGRALGPEVDPLTGTVHDAR